MYCYNIHQVPNIRINQLVEMTAKIKKRSRVKVIYGKDKGKEGIVLDMLKKVLLIEF